MTDYKFDIDGKQLSSEEINAKKDFDSFYKGVQAKSKSFYQKSWFWASTGLASLAAILLITNLNNSNDNSFSENSPFVNPPFEHLKVESDVFNVEANKGGIFKNRHGSILKIPAFAFFNKKGKTIKDQTVQVEFTEYKDVVDQIISGIPMEYDSAGIKYMFSSAGMVEIRGFIGDSAVNLNPEKPIEVEMKSNYKSTEYNFYCLNEKDKKWDYLGKDSVSRSPETDEGKTQDFNSGNNIDKSDISIPKEEIEAKLQAAPEYQKRAKKRIQIQQEIEILEDAVPSKPIKANEEAEKFSLDILEEENPELLPYKNVQFQLAPGEKINPQHTNQNWNKVDLEKGEGNEVVITFSKTNSRQKVEYKAIPVLEGKAFDEAHQQYLAHFDNIKEKKQELKEAEQQIKFLRKEIKKKSVDKEFAIQQLDMAEKMAQLKNAQAENAQANKTVTRFFTVNNFGIYNCDKASNMIVKKEQKIQKIEFGKEKGLLKTYDVFSNENGVYSQHISLNNFYKDFKNETITIGIRAGKLGVLKQTPIENGILSFEVKGKPSSKRELKKWLDI